MRPYEIVCPNCQKKFYIHNKFVLKVRNRRYCSRYCMSRKYTLQDEYFSGDLSSDKLVTFGQMIACSRIKDEKRIVVTANKETLEKISKSIGSTYPMVKARGDRFRFTIISTKMVIDLSILGLSNNPKYQEYPPYDVISGLFDTDCYSETNGVKRFKTKSSKLALEVCRLVNGSISTELCRDSPRGKLDINNIVTFS